MLLSLEHEARLQSSGEVGKLNLSQITCASELPAQPSEVALMETAPPKKRNEPAHRVRCEG